MAVPESEGTVEKPAAEPKPVSQPAESSQVPQFAETSEVIQSEVPKSSEPNSIPNTSASNAVSISKKPTQLQMMMIRRGILPGPMPEPNLNTVEKQLPYDDYKILRDRETYVLILLLTLTFFNLLIAVIRFMRGVMITGSDALIESDHVLQTTVALTPGAGEIRDYDPKILIAQVKVFQRVHWMDRLKTELVYVIASWLLFVAVIILRFRKSAVNCIIGYILMGTYTCCLIGALAVLGKGFVMEDFVRNVLFAVLNYEKTLEGIAQAHQELFGESNMDMDYGPLQLN